MISYDWMKGHWLFIGLRSVLSDNRKKYCKFGNFRENFIFTNSIKDIFATLKIRD